MRTRACICQVSLLFHLAIFVWWWKRDRRLTASACVSLLFCVFFHCDSCWLASSTTASVPWILDHIRNLTPFTTPHLITSSARDALHAYQGASVLKSCHRHQIPRTSHYHQHSCQQRSTRALVILTLREHRLPTPTDVSTFVAPIILFVSSMVAHRSV